VDNQKTHLRLNNGLQSFADASPEYSLAPVGIASMKEQAKKLAEYGRNGDVYVVHAAEGETVVPMEVLNANPQIKQLLFSQMKDMGLQPEEFIVGNELNSINPDTGLPEFFFKSIFRSVKNVVGKVASAAKKLAPTILPIAATFMFPYSPILAGAIGGGLGSLAGGGSLKDAFKNALVSGGTAGLFKGGMNLLQGGSFGEGISKAFYDSTAPSFSQQLNRLKSGLGGNTGDLEKFFLMSAPSVEKAGGYPTTFDGPSYVEGQKIPPAESVDGPVTLVSDSGKKIIPRRTLTPVSPKREKTALEKYLINELANRKSTMVSPEIISAEQLIKGVTPKILEQNIPIDSGGPFGTEIGGKIQRAILGTNYTTEDVLKAAGLNKIPLGTGSALDQIAGSNLTKTAAKIAEKSSAGTLRKYGPLAAAGLGAAYLGGAFDAPPVEEVSASDLEGFTQGPTGFDLFEEDEEKFKVPVNPFLFTPRSRDQLLRPTMFAASGGVVQGPGTGTSDSIPAFLSDGEFVFTDAAVRGADPTGQGITELGANNLYNMMKKFEMRS
jgi:hypothetical protein